MEVTCSIVSNTFSVLGLAGVLNQQRDLVNAFFLYNIVQVGSASSARAGSAWKAEPDPELLCTETGHSYCQKAHRRFHHFQKQLDFAEYGLFLKALRLKATGVYMGSNSWKWIVADGRGLPFLHRRLRGCGDPLQGPIQGS